MSLDPDQPEPNEEEEITRSATEIIDQAIHENRFAEIVLYSLAVAVVLVGSSVLVYGVLSGQTVVSIVGVISNSLFVPAMMFAKRIRTENIAIRLLEASLIRADTAREAAEAIRENFAVSNTPEFVVWREKATPED